MNKLAEVSVDDDVNVNGNDNIDDSVGVSNEEDATDIRAKLLHTLSIFPQISSSMMQIAMNPLRAGDWRPLLEDLIREGKVIRCHYSTTSSVGRSITYTIIRSINPYAALNTVMDSNPTKGLAEKEQSPAPVVE